MTISNNTLSKWSKMTDDNQHAEVLEAIAVYFSIRSDAVYINFSCIFGAIKIICDREGHCPSNIYQYRTEKMNELLDTIKTIEGEEIYNQVYQCL